MVIYKVRLYFLALAVSIGVRPSSIGREVYLTFNRRRFVKPGVALFEFSFCRCVSGWHYVRRLLFFRYPDPALGGDTSLPGRLVQFEQFEQNRWAYAKHRGNRKVEIG